jgi:hypothetical protein
MNIELVKPLYLDYDEIVFSYMGTYTIVEFRNDGEAIARSKLHRISADDTVTLTGLKGKFEINLC